MQSRKQSIVRALANAGLLLASIIVCASTVVLLRQFEKPDDQLPFEPAGWAGPMVDSQGFTGTRLKMVDDLLNRYDFRGWSIRNVQGLLGKPDQERFEQDGRVVEYDLRDGLKFLVFVVDSQDRVVDCHVHMDD
jgi:hypothetical protein